MPDSITTTAPDGTEVDIERIKTLRTGGVRLDVQPAADADDRRWRLDVSASGSSHELVTSWRGDELADVDEPDWLEDVLATLTQAAV